MTDTFIKKLDLNIYNEKLNNGLDIYLIPKDTVKNIYVTFTTKYGSTNIEFIPNGENNFYKSPYGVAHFLEHKLFEQKNGEDPFSFYSKTGCSNNAYTNFFNTTYLFNGPINFENNLEYLLNFVQEPYFTDENVEKEKGIIIQELQMYKDNPYRYGLEKILNNSFSELPIKIPTIGTIDSIKSITKEDLYKCYQTFYHPSNMMLVITGNIDINNTIELIKKNQDNKKYEEAKDILIKKYEEPNEVVIEQEKISMNVSIPKLFMGYKINISDIDLPKHRIVQYMGIYLDSKLGPISKFSEDLKAKELINTDLDFTFIYVDHFIEIVIIAETNDVDKLQKNIIEEMNKLTINIDDFNRKKKVFLSSNIYMSDNIYKLNDKIISDIILENKIIFDVYEEYQQLNFNDLKNMINNLNFNNKTSLVINHENTCKMQKN